MGGTAFRTISRAVWPNAKRRQKDIEARWVQKGDANHNGYPSSTFAAHFRAAFGAVQPLMNRGFGISWYSVGGGGLVVALVVSSVFVLRTSGLGFVLGSAPYWQTQVEDVTQSIADFNMRCFLFDETGKFIEGYYIVGLLAAAFLAQKPGEKIIHDPRLTWNTIDIVEQASGVPIQSKTGHAFLKERMRAENAIYGGEMSAHHYLLDFAYCDSGMIPWLLVAELMSATGKPLSSLVAEREAAYPCSGEINYQVADAKAAMSRVEAHFSSLNPAVDRTDGISLEFADWRLNLRSSNTEPLLRLNVEARGNAPLVSDRVREVETLIGATR